VQRLTRSLAHAQSGPQLAVVPAALAGLLGVVLLAGWGATDPAILLGAAAALLAGGAFWARVRDQGERARAAPAAVGPGVGSARESDGVRALLRVSAEIARGAPVAETVQAICRSARESLGADRAVLLRWDDDRETFVAAVRDGGPEDGAGGPAVEAVVEELSTADEGRVIAADLAHGGHRHGLLVVQRTRTAGRFDARDTAVLEGIGRQCGLALDNLRLRDEVEDTSSLAFTLLDIAQELNQALDPSSLLGRLAVRARELTGATVAVIALRAPATGVYRIETAEGLSPEEAERLLGIELEEGVLGVHLVRAAGADDEAGWHLLVPLGRGGERVGVMLLAWRAGEGPARRAAALAFGLAGEAAIALQTVQLLNDSREASRLKSEFVATMSHELRTPLNVIMGYTDLLVEEAFGGLNEEQASVLARMQHSARELLDLITATLDLNRLEAGKTRVVLEETDVAELLARLEAETTGRLDLRGLEMRFVLHEGLPSIMTDRAKLHMVLKNLIHNAIKFTVQGGVTVIAEASDDAVTFTVADTGIGIRAEDLPVIFEMFRQVECANTRRHGGVGLGLYIVRRLLAELRGEIDVDSEPGTGSRFRVRVPIAPAGPTSADAADD
jgi:signal transduction histidine kinase